MRATCGGIDWEAVIFVFKRSLSVSFSVREGEVGGDFFCEVGYFSAICEDGGFLVYNLRAVGQGFLRCAGGGTPSRIVVSSKFIQFTTFQFSL